MSDLVQSAKMDKTVLSVASLGDEPDDKAYWLSKSPAERWQALELLRQIAYGYDPATERLQRVLEVVDLGAEDLKANERAAGRTKDLSDLEHLP